MSQKFIVNGGGKIKGEIEVKGAKNYALKALAASLLTEEKSTISNLPQIVDVPVMIELMKKMGAVVKETGPGEIKIDAKKISDNDLDPKEVRRVRASIVFSGPLLARTGEITIPHPGGDIIGKRPIDFFLEGFKEMGAKIFIDDLTYKIKTKGRLKGTKIFFPKISVTGTETLAMAATLAKGKTVLENCAMEPEVVCLLESLNQMGAKIKGIGSSLLEIEGVDSLKGGNFKIIPDRLETGTFIMMGLMNNSEIKVNNCDINHIGALLDRLKQAGAKLEIGNCYIKTIPQKTKLKATGIQTHEYPGFATDLQPMYTLLMTQAQGISMIHEPIFEGRLYFTDILNRMGADIIMCDPHRVIVNGPTTLYPRQIESPDIRAGVTLLLAAVMAKGKSTIEQAQIIDRGYEDIDGRLRQVGVDILRA
ncbi:MAG: UDP-N-acetylglucosamine 1-carboxyvinyltransferase [Candidatus Moranbacteria bacterium]|nr:UDP-N-acetylglucosamine 1-carboxyvinyltransferase [Candidatus Moranbacteria bacterium]